MTEAKFQTAFNRWVKYNFKRSAAFELKLARGDSLPFAAVKPHQIQNLKIVKRTCLQYKISDIDFTFQKPFDSFNLCGEAYVVVMFYVRGQKEFVMIDVDDFEHESIVSSRRSLVEERAKEIGKTYVLGVLI